jgi:hypothetical protein
MSDQENQTREAQTARLEAAFPATAQLAYGQAVAAVAE